MDHLGSLVVIAQARRAGDPGLNPGPGENFSLKLLIYILFSAYPFCDKSKIFDISNILEQTTFQNQWCEKIFVGSQRCQKSSHFQLHNFKFKEIALFYNYKNSSGILIINQYIWHLKYN